MITESYRGELAANLKDCSKISEHYMMVTSFHQFEKSDRLAV